MSTPAAPPAITTTGELSAGAIDPMLEAIRQAIIDTETGVLAEFGALQVIITPPDATEKTLTQEIGVAMGRSKGLALLLIAGEGTNPDPAAPGPLLNLSLEMQLYVSPRIRARDANAPLTLVLGLAKTLHLGEIGVTGIPWYERLRFLSFAPLADPDFTAYALAFERQMEL